MVPSDVVNHVQIFAQLRVVSFSQERFIGVMSMYSNKFVISILVNNQIQKEFSNGDVNLPFGTEYAIRFRNKNDRNAVVMLYIDGEKMCRGGFIIPVNSYRDIECSSQTLRKFKFVDLQSTEAQEHGKDQVNTEKLMGVIEAHWYLEKTKPVIKEIRHDYHHRRKYFPGTSPWKTYDNAADEKIQFFGAYSDANVPCSIDEPVEFSGKSVSLNQNVRDGATVEGEYSSQRFGEMNLEIEENATILRLQLKGYDSIVQEYQKIEAPTRIQYCDKCGAKAVKESSKFCHQCGNKLG